MIYRKLLSLPYFPTDCPSFSLSLFWNRSTKTWSQMSLESTLLRRIFPQFWKAKVVFKVEEKSSRFQNWKARNSITVSITSKLTEFIGMFGSTRQSVTVLLSLALLPKERRLVCIARGDSSKSSYTWFSSGNLYREMSCLTFVPVRVNTILKGTFPNSWLSTLKQYTWEVFNFRISPIEYLSGTEVKSLVSFLW